MRVLSSANTGREYRSGEHGLPSADGALADGPVFRDGVPATAAGAVPGADRAIGVSPRSQRRIEVQRHHCAVSFSQRDSGFHLQPETITYTFGVGKSKYANAALYQYFNRSFYNRFRYIHCPSSMIAGELMRYGYTAHCRVISNGVSEQFRPRDVSRPLSFQNKYVVLVVGRLSAEKRQDVVIKAVRSSKYANRIQLVFAGRGPKEKKYKKLGKGLPNTPLLEFYPQEELIQLFNACDLYVHASDAEIEGIACMEATACGAVPVISDSDLSATKSFALHPNSLFRAGDAQSLAEKLDYWIENPQEKAEMSWLYVQRAEQMRVSRCAEEMEALYKDVIADYWSNGYKQPEESRFRRITHPNAARTMVTYSKMTPVKRILFSLLRIFWR